MNPLDLTGKVALVTGGGTGIGLMIANQLSKNGAKVYITGRRLEVLQKVASDHNNKLIPLQMNVVDKDSIRSAAQIVEENDGKLDILVNNAGVSGPMYPFISDKSAPEHSTMGDSLFAQTSFDQWTEVFQTNTFAPFFVTTGFLSLLEKGARSRGEGETSSVINISSCVGTMNITMNSFIYVTSKAGVNHLTTSMATEFALSKIPVRVNCISPGAFPSQLTGSEDALNSYITQLPGTINPPPALRAGREHEIGMTAVFLSSSAGEYTNGVVLVVDGGLSLVNP
ncbi:short-chain dehydrogenase [Dendrothele bispora CBS 962.96]|uniref:Short-chain dehydrogenase n=1 Tax=Dendrothele bispora (strain CBS 962.96) TaxID=1314807 RepID=A0A4S8L761_DENBC|nr:short-chain dehydrogenase [Dendrothele bispora CBS 962.96]